MSKALVHFSIGFGSILLIMTFIGESNDPHIVLFAVFSGLYGLIPDLHHMLPVYDRTYHEVVHDSVLANLFWGHRLLDVADPANSNGVLFLSLVYLTFCVLFRELYVSNVV